MLKHLACIIFFFNGLLFLEKFQVHSKIKQKTQRVPRYFLPLHTQPPPLSVPAPEWDMCYNPWTYTDMSLSPRPTVHIRVNS